MPWVEVCRLRTVVLMWQILSGLNERMVWVGVKICFALVSQKSDVTQDRRGVGTSTIGLIALMECG